MADRTSNGKGPFEIKYDDAKGLFDIRIFQKHMLGTKLTARIGKQEAILVKAEQKKGRDHEGQYDFWRLEYASQKNEDRTITCTMTIRDSYTVFESELNYEVKGKKNKYLYGDPYISFPSFEGDKWDENCSCFSFKRQAPFNYPELWQGKITDSLREGKNSPLIAANKKFETIVLSPLNHLMFNTVAVNHLPGRVRCGIPRAVNKIEKGTKTATILVYGIGINKTIDCWGALLREHHGVDRIEKDADVLLKYISYWTNAGSAYWYDTYKKTSYEETLKKLRDHHKMLGLHFGSYQLDSWWYRKEGDDYTSGIIEWEPKSATNAKNFNSMLPFKEKLKKVDLFQENSLSYVQSFLKKPIGCHFKQLAKDSVYFKNAPEDFIVEDFPIPKNKMIAEKLFLEIFKHPRWNLAYVVHDWLSFMNDRHSAFRDLEVSSDYFTGLDQACRQIDAPANERGFLSVQLCMSQPHMTLESVRLAAVTTIRSTSDSDSFFVEGTKRWWWNLYSSKLIQALGKYAFYDNRYSSKSHVHPLSAYSKFEFIWIGLSCGPLGIGDEIGKENVELIRRCIKNDGEIIKPDIPAAPLDKCFLYNPYTIKNDKGVAVASYSKIKAARSCAQAETQYYQVFYLLVFNTHPFGRKVDFSLRLDELIPAPAKEYILYNYFTKEIRKVSLDQDCDYPIKRRVFYYEIIAPIEKGIAVLGDVSKHVSMSGQLVDSIIFGDGRCDIMIKYAEESEISRYLFYLETKPSNVLLNGTVVGYEYKQEKLEIHLDWKNADLNINQNQKLTIIY
ncbi:MAG: hypothetical protein WBV27_03010 [Trichococcus sp.]|uniref:hypothetical protein n=1 Tax=Trichococcus sp. TaxID=1985464 RepID=UPI003C4F3CE9